MRAGTRRLVECYHLPTENLENVRKYRENSINERKLLKYWSNITQYVDALTILENFK